MQRVSTGGPDYVWSRLEVSGERNRLYDFINAASGPGFLDWEVEWYGVYEEAYGSVLLGGAGSIGAASALAHKLTDRSWRLVGEARRAAELDPTRCPFDLNALIPVPETVLRHGYRGAGEAWLWRHWGIGAPLRRVTLEIVQRPLQEKLPQITAVYRFLSEDWAPAIAIASLRKVWLDLRFELACDFSGPVARPRASFQTEAKPRPRCPAGPVDRVERVLAPAGLNGSRRIVEALIASTGPLSYRGPSKGPTS